MGTKSSKQSITGSCLYGNKKPVSNSPVIITNNNQREIINKSLIIKNSIDILEKTVDNHQERINKSLIIKNSIDILEKSAEYHEIKIETKPCDLLVADLKYLLYANLAAKSKDAQIFTVEKICQLLVANEWFIRDKKKLSDTVQSKFKEFKNSWPEIILYGHQLFPDDPDFAIPDFSIVQDQIIITSSNDTIIIEPSSKSTSEQTDELKSELTSDFKSEQKVNLSIESKVLNIQCSESNCRICMIKNINSIILPCCHVYFCMDCAINLKQCAICQGQIVELKKIFTPLV